MKIQGVPFTPRPAVSATSAFQRPAALDGATELAELSPTTPDGGSSLYLGTDNELYVVSGSIAGPQYSKLEAGRMQLTPPEADLETIATIDPGGPDHGTWVARDAETGNLWLVKQSIAGPQYRPLLPGND
jgi:hypothetical protein